VIRHGDFADGEARRGNAVQGDLMHGDRPSGDGPQARHGKDHDTAGIRKKASGRATSTRHR
jgi:hypothetical protein